MARTIDERLKNLKSRRSGTDPRSYGRLNESERAQVLAKSLGVEPWQRRATSQPYTRYALGSMQAVSEEYTRIGIDTAERIGRQLKSGLTMPIEFRLQGSVPLDVHIRGVSDVDLLVLDANFLTYATAGVRSAGGFYSAGSNRNSVEVLQSLRREAETLLRSAYYAADVDCSGAKCISLSGGSLARPVDVVPAHWWDTADYQRTVSEQFRGVTILDKKRSTTIDNLPFLHIASVNTRDAGLLGGAQESYPSRKKCQERRCERQPGK